MEAPEAVFVKTENTSGDPSLWVSSFHEQGDIEKLENSGEEYDGVCLQKKRRLNADQVQFLEKSFELENKLEPERKAQLAKEVGLQPRQVAIWFQNRRARYKTKLLEKDYSTLKASYDKLKSDYAILLKENQEIRNEIKVLTEKKGVTPSNDQKSDQIVSPKKVAGAATANSDVLDSDSVHCPESEYSQEEEDVSLCKIMLHHPFFPKLELESNDDLQPNCCNLGFPVQSQGTWFWHY